ncbi:SIR2 family protein [Streptomyces sp. NPDC001930]|uniref:P-loop NTPase n=1 Tax=Streptomyces sp. NPDC001930 TaxID=3364625 RepID=UPI0036C34AB3
MAGSAYGDLDDLRTRLLVVKQQAGGARRLVPVFGSGLSNQVLPDVRELTRAFREAIPTYGHQKFDEGLARAGSTVEQYQVAAQRVELAAGSTQLCEVVRRAVLGACESVRSDQIADFASDEAECRNQVSTGRWRLPDGYRRFAEFFACLDGGVRGPIITTNFDPLIEVALREVGLHTAILPMAGDVLFDQHQLRVSTDQPVLHIHGYWTLNLTLHSAFRLTQPRPGLSRLLDDLLVCSDVLVLGYAGWQDSFMKTLVEHMDRAEYSAVEVLWAAYSNNVDSVREGSLITKLLERPRFQLYLGIDGHELFADAIPLAELPSRPQPPNRYTLLPLKKDDVRHNPARFADGHQPDWPDAEPGAWPMLAAATELHQRLGSVLDADGGGGVVASGPLGEGKSLALRQVALLTARERPNWTVLWRESGAPPLNASWLHQQRERYGRVLICADEADLLAVALRVTQSEWGKPGSNLASLLASHDRLWRAHRIVLGPIAEVEFHGITREDAQAITGAWLAKGLLPSAVAQNAAEEIAEHLSAAAGAMIKHGCNSTASTLFGAVLQVRHGDRLGDRVGELLAKLAMVPLSTVQRLHSSVSVGDIFGGICVLQEAQDPDGNLGHGASRPVLAAMADLEAGLANGTILEVLGREAAVTFAGNRVYSRHPAIAHEVVEQLRAQGELGRICKLVGYAGGRLHASGEVSPPEYQPAYLLAKKLIQARRKEARDAAAGAVAAAPDLLQPKVTMLSVLRRLGDDTDETAAREVARRLSRFRDAYSDTEGFLVEFSHILRRHGQPQTAAGLAVLGLDNRINTRIGDRRLGYALVALIHAVVALRTQTSADGKLDDIPEVAYELLVRIEGEVDAARHLGSCPLDSEKRGRARPRAAGTLVKELHQGLSSYALKALSDTSLDLTFVGSQLDMGELERRARHPIDLAGDFG